MRAQEAWSLLSGAMGWVTCLGPHHSPPMGGGRKGGHTTGCEYSNSSSRHSFHSQRVFPRGSSPPGKDLGARERSYSLQGPRYIRGSGEKKFKVQPFLLSINS